MNGSTKMWNVVFVLGPPGSGKGTQCSKIVEKFGYTHLSAGELLREEMHREGSQFGKLIDEHIKTGVIVPVAITCKLLENAMIANHNQRGYLIDGFPRNQDNLDGWMREMGHKTKTQFVLFLQCTEKTPSTSAAGGTAGWWPLGGGASNPNVDINQNTSTSRKANGAGQRTESSPSTSTPNAYRGESWR